MDGSNVTWTWLKQDSGNVSARARALRYPNPSGAAEEWTHYNKYFLLLHSYSTIVGDDMECLMVFNRTQSRIQLQKNQFYLLQFLNINTYLM